MKTASNLNHDGAGFLVGEAIDPKDLSGIIDIWDQIRGDIATIKGFVAKVEEASQTAAPTARTKSRDQTVVDVTLNEPRVASTPNQAQKVLQHTESTSHKEVVTPTRPPKAATPVARDAQGRFIKGSDGTSDTSPNAQVGELGLFDDNKVAERIGRAVADATGSADSVDPTLQAMREVATPVTGVVSTLSGLGGNKDPERRSWFRRIYSEIKAFRAEETAYSKASARSLKGIEKKPKEGGGILSTLIGLFTRLPIVLAGLMGGAFSGVMAGLGTMMGGLMKGGKGLLKRIPILGALLSSAGGLFDIFSSETDDSLTRGEKDKKTGKGAGSIAGTLGGMWAGAKMGAALGALGGPIGAAIGGVVGGAAGMFFGEKAGAVIGETVGGWVADLREADIAGYFRDKWEAVTGGISAAWDSTTTFFADKWESITASIGAAWDSSVNYISDTFTSVMTSIFGEKWAGIADSISQKWDSMTNTISDKWSAVTDSFKEKWTEITDSIKGFFGDIGKKANDYVKEKTGVDVAETAQNAKQKASDAADWVGEKTTAAKDWVKDGWQTLTGSGKSAEATNPSKGAKLPKGHRGRHQFDGIAGGGKLSKMGTYTDAEAQRIRELKSSGANTGANLPGGMPADIQQKIRASAEAHGLDPEMMLAIAAMESGGNKNAISETGAAGVYQFVGRTATGVGIEDRFDADQNIDGAMRLTMENKAVLEKHGLPLTPENIYMVHQLGPSAAVDLISGAQAGKSVGDLKTSTRSGMDLNYGSKSSTASEYLAKNRKALEARYTRVVANSDAGIVNQPTEVASAEPTEAAPAEVVEVIDTEPTKTPGAAGGHKEPVYASADAQVATPAVTAYMPAVASPAMPAPQAVPPAPTTQSPLGSTGKKDQQTVTVEAPEAGQDVRDRQIAHIVTGGISGS